MILSLVTSTAFASDLVVDPAGAGDFTSLQDAFDSAQDGDTLYVRDGDYDLGTVFELTHSNGAVRTWGAAFAFDKSLTVIGESVDGVVVSVPSVDAERMYGFLLTSGTSRVESLTLVHGVPGTTTDAGTQGLDYAYGVFGSFQGDEPAGLVVRNVVVAFTADHDKTLLYANGDQTSIVAENVTVDFRHEPGTLCYVNDWGAHELHNLVVENVSSDCAFPSEGGGIGGDYYLLHGSGLSDGNVLDADPMFADPAGLDYRLLDGSPAIDAGNPDASFNDDDGTRNDLGAHGGAVAVFPDLDPVDTDEPDSDEPVTDTPDEGGCSSTPRPGLVGGLAALGFGLLLRRRS